MNINWNNYILIIKKFYKYYVLLCILLFLLKCSFDFFIIIYKKITNILFNNDGVSNYLYNFQ